MIFVHQANVKPRTIIALWTSLVLA